jgi:hypothetical protein
LLIVERCLERGKEVTSKAGSIKWSSPRSAMRKARPSRANVVEGEEERVLRREGRRWGEKESAVVQVRHALRLAWRSISIGGQSVAQHHRSSIECRRATPAR